MSTFKHITSAEAGRILKSNLSPFLETLEEALSSFSSHDQKVIQPQRTPVSVDNHNGLFLTMPAYSSFQDIFTTKIVTVFPENPKKGLPSIQSNVFVFSSSTGSFKAVIEGNDLTAIRTAAVSAIATKYLACGSPKILTLLGSGVQARSHLWIFQKMYSFEEVRVWNHRKETGLKLVEEIRALNLKSDFFENAEDAVRNADIVVTSTLSKVSILNGAWLKPGAHVNAVGACDPTWRELDDELMHGAKIYVDSKEAALSESGDIILSKAPIFAEIGEVIMKKKPALKEDLTVFSSQGMAIEDTVAASLVYKYY